MNCDERTGGSHTVRRNLITAAVFEDDAIIYVKGETNMAVELISG